MIWYHETMNYFVVSGLFAFWWHFGGQCTGRVRRGGTRLLASCKLTASFPLNPARRTFISQQQRTQLYSTKCPKCSFRRRGNKVCAACVRASMRANTRVPAEKKWMHVCAHVWGQVWLCQLRQSVCPCVCSALCSCPCVYVFVFASRVTVVGANLSALP